MANTKISDLTQIDALADNDALAVADTSLAASRKVTGTQLSTYVNANLTLGANMDVSTYEIISSTGNNIILHSDNDVNVVLGDAAGIDDFNIKDSGDATVFSVNSDGAITATSYGGVLEANLVDKSADETITGNWTFNGDIGVGGFYQTFIAGGTISSGDVVYMAATGKVLPADANDTAIAARVLGIAQEAAVLDGNVQVMIGGISDVHSSLTIGSYYYLSGTAGAITTTAPSTSGDTVVKVGVAVSATELMVRPEVIYVVG